MAVTRYSLRVGMLFERDVTGWEEGRRLMEPFFAAPLLRPERAASFDDVRRDNGVETADVDALERVWALPAEISGPGGTRTFAAETEWRRWAAPAGTGRLSFASRMVRGGIAPGRLSLRINDARRVGPLMVELFDHLCEVLSPSAAFLQPFTSGDTPRGHSSDIARRAAADFALGLAWSKMSVGDTNRPVEGRSDLGWCGLVPARDIDDRAALEGVADLRPFGDLIRVRFGLDPLEAVQAPDEVEARHRTARRALAPDAFLVPAEAEEP